MKEKKKINIEIGKRIKKSREGRGLTQERLAEEIDVSIQYISDLERGVVGASTSTLINICRILDASADYILFGKDPNTISDVSDRLKEYTPKQVESMYRIMDIIDDFYRTDDEWKSIAQNGNVFFVVREKIF